MANDKFSALEYTLDFLARYHLDWKDYMTQCILSHILSDVHPLSTDVLETFYQDCLNKDRQLDELAAEQREDIERRQLGLFQQSQSNGEDRLIRFSVENALSHSHSDLYNKDPYMPLTKSQTFVIASDNYDNAPLSFHDDLDDEPTSMSVVAIAQALAEKAESERFNTFYIDSDNGEEFDVGERPAKLILEESSMSEGHKERGYLMKSLYFRRAEQSDHPYERRPSGFVRDAADQQQQTAPATDHRRSHE